MVQAKSNELTVWSEYAANVAQIIVVVINVFAPKIIR